MREKWLIAGLVAMNVALLASNWSISRSALGIAGNRTLPEVENLLKRQTGLLSIERAELSLKLTKLSDLAGALREIRPTGARPPGVESPQNLPPPEDVQRMLSAAEIDEKPDPLSMAIMTDQEKLELSEAIPTLPPVTLSPLRPLEIDALLADKAWNPNGRELSLEERTKATKLLKDNHYFTFVSVAERLQTLMKPELPRMIELQAYVDYNPKDGELPYDGVTINHTEVFSKDRYRMYYFPRDLYPDLYTTSRSARSSPRKPLSTCIG